MSNKKRTPINPLTDPTVRPSFSSQGPSTLNRTERRQRAQIMRGLQKHIAQHGIESLLRRMFGETGYTYDAQEKLWIVPNDRHTGPGKAYYCINAQGDWFMAHMPDSGTQ